MGATYNNDIQEHEVSLAIEQLLVGAVGATFPTGRIDISSPPAGFVHLGAVVEDSPSVSIQRQKFQLSTGIPSILQYDVVQGLSGQFSMSFYSNSNRIVRYALGGAAPRNTIAGTSAINTATSRTQVTVATPSVFAVGDLVCTDTSASSLSVSDNTAEISSISGGVVYFKGNGLGTKPANSDSLGKVSQVDLVFGTTQLPRYALIGVADFIDDVQVQHHFPKVSPVGEFTESINPGNVGIVQATWDLFATDGGATWGNEYILGKRIYVPRNA
jgi:hypothetical protein